MGEGLVTNTRVELLSLWVLLHFASLNGISNISIYGDSKIIIEWDKGVYGLQVLNIKQWCWRVKLLIKEFNHLSFKHISRSLNKEANRLSKKSCFFKRRYFMFSRRIGRSNYNQWIERVWSIGSSFY